jgi:hypothetical protein
MPRQARLDAQGTLHHVILRGLERGQRVADAEERAAAPGAHIRGCEGARASRAATSPLSQTHPGFHVPDYKLLQ